MEWISAILYFGSGIIAGLVQQWRHPKYTNDDLLASAMIFGPFSFLIVLLDWKLDDWEKEDKK